MCEIKHAQNVDYSITLEFTIPVSAGEDEIVMSAEGFGKLFFKALCKILENKGLSGTITLKECGISFPEVEEHESTR